MKAFPLKVGEALPLVSVAFLPDWDRLAAPICSPDLQPNRLRNLDPRRVYPSGRRAKLDMNERRRRFYDMEGELSALSAFNERSPAESARDGLRRASEARPQIGHQLCSARFEMA
jgi:hypothetical protein